VYVYDSHTDKSTLNVYDAATMSQQPLARVRLPRRVPYGFHSLWVREEQLAAQA
jgi:carotenoid 9,10(9',10')-cleavage dioxygenase 1